MNCDFVLDYLDRASSLGAEMPGLEQVRLQWQNGQDALFVYPLKWSDGEAKDRLSWTGMVMPVSPDAQDD